MDAPLLQGKTALVTGSSGGIGRAIAEALLALGARVAVHGRDKERVDEVVATLQAAGGDATGICADLVTIDETKALANEASARLGRVDILVNNAAIFPQHQWADGTGELWQRVMSVNVVAPAVLVTELMPAMKVQRWGRIVQISSGEAQLPFAHMPAYAASKAALNNMTISLAKALAGTGVTANTIAPGLVHTEEVERWFRNEAGQRGWPEDWAGIESKVLAEYLPIPVGRMGTPAEIAELVAFVVSPRASYIHGATLRIDGGSTGTV